MSDMSEGHCVACGEYLPWRLNGRERVEHDCGRTPPAFVAVNIFACPVCFGYGSSRFGCWGTETHPHPHAYMESVYDLLTARVALRA